VRGSQGESLRRGVRQFPMGIPGRQGTVRVGNPDLRGRRVSPWSLGDGDQSGGSAPGDQARRPGSGYGHGPGLAEERRPQERGGGYPGGGQGRRKGGREGDP